MNLHIIKPRLRLGKYTVWLYRMPWSLNYKRPGALRLKDGWQFTALSFVLMVAADAAA